jgi:hypothetical protein
VDVLGFATLGFAFDGVPGEPVDPTPPPASTGGGGFYGTVQVRTHYLGSSGGLRLASASSVRPIYVPAPKVVTLASSGGLRLDSESTITVRRSTRDLEDLALLGLARP